jgi:membrane dipeptidase
MKYLTNLIADLHLFRKPCAPGKQRTCRANISWYNHLSEIAPFGYRRQLNGKPISCACLWKENNIRLHPLAALAVPAGTAQSMRQMTDLTKMLMVDAHQDLAYNMITFGRDYTRTAKATRELERGGPAPERTGDTLLGWPEYQRGRVAVIFATLFAAPLRRKLGEWDLQCYADTAQARHLYRSQIDAYQRLTDDHPDNFRLIHVRDDLRSVLDHWGKEDEEQHPVGLVILMEGAEGVHEPRELEEWRQLGVRIIGPAWAGTRFCGGTREPGPLTKEGYALLEGMAEFGFILDLSHMDEQAALQALDAYPGALIASHSNAQALLGDVQTNRHLSDRVIQGLLERGGIIGVVPANSFLKPGWKDSGGREGVTLDHVVAQIDYICQMAGDAQHTGIGTDYDGGFGLQSVPAEIETIADIRKIASPLAERGYSDDDIAAIFGGNLLRLLHDTLPEGL